MSYFAVKEMDQETKRSRKADRCPTVELAWGINLDSLKAGAFGNPEDPETLLRYWKAQEAAGFPYASENVRYFEELARKKGESTHSQLLRDLLSPKKPEMRATEGFDPEMASELCCPQCHGPVTNYWVRGAKPKHCQFCGQAIDWEEEAER